MPLALGYYFADSRHGNFLREVRSYTSFTFCEAGDFYDGSMAKFERALRSARRLGFKIHLNFQWGDPDVPPFEEVVKVAAPVWDAVELVDLRDEPGGHLATAVRALRKAIRGAGLKRRPIGAVFTQPDIIAKRARFASLNWVGIEAYVHPRFQASAAGAVREMRRLVHSQLALIPRHKAVVVVGQAYDRNGNWSNIRSLKALQKPTWRAARRDPRVTHLRWFSYGRQGGTRQHRALIREHKETAVSVRGDA